MREFKSIDEFNIIGRGKVLLIPSDRERLNSSDTKDLLGQIVLIDSKEYIITGIEFQGYRGWRLNDPIACLVRTPTEEERIQQNTPYVKIDINKSSEYILIDGGNFNFNAISNVLSQLEGFGYDNFEIKINLK